MSRSFESGEPPGSWLRRQREAAGLTQEEIAEQSGLSVRTVRNLESGQTGKPHPRSLRVVVAALGLSEVAAAEVTARYRVRSGGSGLSQRDNNGVPDPVPVPAGELPGHVTGAPVGAVPRQLPAAVTYFAGRTAELAMLDGWRELATGKTTGAMVISAIAGMAGVGKTALAVHWAHQVAGHFPDGQLYINLRGFGPSGIPVRPADAIRGFLNALDVGCGRIPGDLDAQARLYRSRLAGKKLLVVLDNARDEAQVRPLLPGVPGCLIVVTSRSQLTGLVAAEGAYPLMLGTLTGTDAHDLLTCRLGRDRVCAEPQAAADLVSLCGGLPLALAVASARAALRPGFPLAATTRKLRDQQRRLDSLRTGETATGVRTVFSWSYQRLAASEARMFRLLGLHPGPDITVPAAACLAAVSPEGAEGLLDHLARVCLLTEHAPGRYALHDLLRAYAAEQASAHETDEERTAVLDRLFGYYLSGASSAVGAFLPAQQFRRRLILPDSAGQSVPQSPAQSWLDAERANLVALVAHADRCGWPERATRLAATLSGYLDRYGHYSDALPVHTQAMHAARRSGDDAAHAHALVDLAGVKWRQGLYQQATGLLEQALATFCETGNRGGQARVLLDFGVVMIHLGHYPRAAGYHHSGLAIFREIGDQGGQANALDNLGIVSCRQGRLEQAAGYHQQALIILRGISQPVSEADVLDNLGVVFCQQGLLEQADECFQKALALFRKARCWYGEAYTLNNLGVLLCRQGGYGHALDLHRQAQTTLHDIGGRAEETKALISMAAALKALGRGEEAYARYRDALSLADQIGNPYLQASARNGLGTLSPPG